MPDERYKFVPNNYKQVSEFIPPPIFTIELATTIIFAIRFNDYDNADDIAFDHGLAAEDVCTFMEWMMKMGRLEVIS